MLKLDMPKYSIDEVIRICCEDIKSDSLLKKHLRNNLERCKIDEFGYIRHAEKGDLYRIIPLPGPKGKDHIIMDSIHDDVMYKSDFIKLYESHFRNKSKRGRTIYDLLMVAANEKCPYCGGIGRPRNLDHYLPKAHYPQFAILPVNLVPSCRDCNMDGKGDGYAKSEIEQVLHPYLDDDRYFKEQWLFAQYISDDDKVPGVIKYFTSPPEHWEPVQKQRVEQHFKEFDLALRFSKEAGARLVPLLSQFENLLQCLNEQKGVLDANNVAKKIIFQSIIDKSPFLNHWERVMCLALISEL